MKSDDREPGICRIKNISWQQVQELLEAPDCIRNNEISKRLNRPVYEFLDGRALLFVDGEAGVLYESVEELKSIVFEFPSEKPFKSLLRRPKKK